MFIENTNLPKQLANLYSYLIFKNNNDRPKKLYDFTDPNHWLNEILLYNIVDILLIHIAIKKYFLKY